MFATSAPTPPVNQALLVATAPPAGRVKLARMVARASQGSAGKTVGLVPTARVHRAAVDLPVRMAQRAYKGPQGVPACRVQLVLRVALARREWPPAIDRWSSAQTCLSQAVQAVQPVMAVRAA